jgi:hypothetical protein
MRRLMTAAVLSLGLAMTAAPHLAQAAVYANRVEITKPAEGTPILVVMPEVSLGMLTAGGTVEPKEEWSQNTRKYLNDGLAKALQGKKYATASTDLAAYEDSQDQQMLKLNDAVTDSIAQNIGLLALPTKTSFDWTLGDGAAGLVPADSATPPAYALFVRCKGSWSSGGRGAAFLAAAAFGAAIPMGGQFITATLVDLKTGQVVWYQFNMVGMGTDIRTPEGAATAVDNLFKTLPL